LENPHLHVVSLTGKDVQRLVLRFQPKRLMVAIVAVALKNARQCKVVVGDWLPIVSTEFEVVQVLDQGRAPKTGVGNPEMMSFAARAARETGLGQACRYQHRKRPVP